MSVASGSAQSNATHARPSSTFTVLVVCAANRCRSPAIASVLDQGAGGHAGLRDGRVRVLSAGTMDSEGVAVDDKTKKALRRAGYASPSSVSQSISLELIASADLILTASRRHRTQVVRMSPGALPRTFTVREFARYCSLILDGSVGVDAVLPAERLEAVVELAREQRGMTLPARMEDDDIPDPAGGSRWTHSRTVRLIVEAAAPILAVAAPQPLAARRRAKRLRG